MSLSVSERVKRVKPSPTMAVTAAGRRALRAAGRDVIGSGCRRTRFRYPPEHIKEAGIAAINEWRDQIHQPSMALPALKQAIIAISSRRDNELTIRQGTSSGVLRWQADPAITYVMARSERW